MASVNKILRQAQANQIKMVLMGYTLGSNYNTQPFDQSWYKDQFLSYENTSNYAQKWQFADQTTLQFHANTVGNFTLQLVDCSQRVWKTYTPQYNIYPGISYLYQGVEYPLTTATFSITFDLNDSGLPEGIYYMLLSVEYDTAAGGGNEETDYHISEPMYLARYHPDTIYIQGTHPRYQYNTFFGTSLFSVRVEGYKKLDNLKSSDTQYNDQDQDMTMLNSYPYRVWLVEFGGFVGIPAWLWDRIHILIGLRTTLYDGLPYTKEEGADWAKNESDNRMWPTINLREPKNYDGFTTVNRTLLTIFTVPVSPAEPYMVHSFVINDELYFVKKPIYNSGDITSLITYLNGAFKTANGFLGTFSLTGGKIVYANAPSENYDTASAALLTKSLVFTKPVTGTSSTVRTTTIDLDYILYGIDYGDGTVIADGEGTPNTILLNHTYPAGTNTFTCRLFHQNSITSIGLLDTTITNITGIAPSDLTDFNIDSLKITSFSGFILTPALAVFETLTIGNTTMAGITGLNQAWGALETFDFRHNKLTSSSVDSAIQQTRQAAFSSIPLQSGSHNLRLESQIPSAPPTIISASDKNTLIFTYSWTVTND